MKILFEHNKSKTKGKKEELIRFKEQIFNESEQGRNSFWRIKTKDFNGVLMKKKDKFELLIKNKPLTIKENFVLLLESETIDGLKYVIREATRNTTFQTKELEEKLTYLELITIFGVAAKDDNENKEKNAQRRNVRSN